jgi:hypothetical protein
LIEPETRRRQWYIPTRTAGHGIVRSSECLFHRENPRVRRPINEPRNRTVVPDSANGRHAQQALNITRFIA